MTAKLSSSRITNVNSNAFTTYLMLAAGMIFTVAFVFSIYSWSEKQVIRANNLRNSSYQLTDELRQSSDDLTRMVRTYVATGKSSYKKYYQEILDIRNGIIPRPNNYQRMYWDFILSGEVQPNINTTPAIALLDLMKQSGFPVHELQKLENSKKQSDKLAKIETKAMALFEAPAAGDKIKALELLYNDKYHLAKADIMRPIHQVTSLMDKRTRLVINQAEDAALLLLIIFAGFVSALIFILFRLYTLLSNQLGGSLSKVQHEISKIGSADFTSIITVPINKESSVLGWLAKTQDNLIKLKHERELADTATKASEQRFRDIVNSTDGIVWEADAVTCNFTFISQHAETMLGYPLDAWLDPGFWLEHIHPDDKNWAPEYCASRTAQLEPHTFDYRFITKEGRTVWLHDVVTVEAEAGKPRWLRGIMVDITAQKKTESALKEKEDRLTLAAAHNGIGIWDFNLLTQKLICDDLSLSLYNIKREDFSHTADALVQLLHPDDRESYKQNIHDAVSGKSPFNQEFRILCSNGATRYIKSVAKVFHDTNGTPLRMLGTATDITEHNIAAQALHESQKKYQDLLDGVGEKFVIYSHNLSGEMLYVSDGVKNVLGLSKEIVLGQNWGDLINWLPGVLEQTQEKVIQMVTGEISFSQHEMRFIHSDGKVRTLHVSAHPVHNQNNEVVTIDGIVEDITERKQAEKDLRIAATAFESQEGMMVTDSDQIILRVNHAFTNITGYSSEEAIGKTPAFLNSGKQDKQFYKLLWKSIHIKGAWQGEIWNRRKNGDIYPEQLTITAVKDSTGITTNYVATLTDITKSKAAVNEIKNLAFYDTLTSLPNRRLFLERLTHALSTSTRTGQHGALLFLDLDNFKILNDTLGHDFGDLLLQETAKRLLNELRESDTAARLGGDEFVVLLKGLSDQEVDAATQAEAVGHKVLTALNAPYILGSHTYNSSSSIGITLFDKSQIKSADLLKQADIAMYQAKRNGRNALCFFEPKMQEVIHAHAELEKSLRVAIKQQQFELYYQIQVAQTGQATGAEALIRWHHPTRGIVSPLDFIPAAEKSKLILPIGQWALESACAQLQSWQQNILTQKLTLSVNVSAKQFSQPNFVTQVKGAIADYAINPKLLNLEITESLLLDRLDIAIATMHALQAIGIKFELDDFGTGYSSLQYLKELPLHQLKIDQSFISDITTNASDQAIVLTIIAMAHNLGLEVIAEGVETEEQRQRLFQKGCLLYQGYLFSKPVPIEEFEALLRSI